MAVAIKGSLLGEKFTLRGDTYTGIIDDVTASEAFASGGSIPSQPISVTMKMRTFTPSIGLGERITARDTTFTIRQITSDEISITLICDVPDHR